MLTFIIEHKYCKGTKEIQGYNIWDALKANRLDAKIWIVKNVEKLF